MKKAVFILQEATKDGVEGYIVKGWENVLKREELPKEYLKDYPNFCEAIDNSVESSGKDLEIAIIPAKVPYFFLIKKDDFVTKKHWKMVYNLMLQAGHRLSKILEEQRKPKVIRVEI